MNRLSEYMIIKEFKDCELVTNPKDQLNLYYVYKGQVVILESD